MKEIFIQLTNSNFLVFFFNSKNSTLFDDPNWWWVDDVAFNAIRWYNLQTFDCKLVIKNYGFGFENFDIKLYFSQKIMY